MRLDFTADLAEAVTGAELVQENRPERIEFKKKLYGQLYRLLLSDVIIASGSSGLTMGGVSVDADLVEKA
jgi:3-hydroxyacyl-CoA dehydrogenase